MARHPIGPFPKRDPLALAMFAAWVNLPVDRLPPQMQGHTCPATMAAWKRVADAARQFIAEEKTDGQEAHTLQA